MFQKEKENKTKPQSFALLANSRNLHRYHKEMKVKSDMKPRVVPKISSYRDDRRGQKSKPQKIPRGFKQNPKNSLEQNLTPKISYA